MLDSRLEHVPVAAISIGVWKWTRTANGSSAGNAPVTAGERA